MKKRKKAKKRRESKGNYIAIDIETYPNRVIASSKHVHYFGDGRSVEIPSAEFPWDLEPKEG